LLLCCPGWGRKLTNPHCTFVLKGVRSSVPIDWTVKEAVRAKMRTMIRRILRKSDCPPDKQEQATTTVIQQAEVICAD
jgi:type I restriction enzyme, R subunit